MSAHRQFMHERIGTGGQSLWADKIECGKCGAVEYLTNTGSRRNPEDMIAKYFRNKGWKIGNGPRADMCPSCQQKEKPKLQVVKSEPKAEAPREMSRADRRIINDKLDEVYGEKSYTAPWTDAAVARDLGVPKAWVERVRDEFFGPEGSNPEYQDFIEKAAPVIADLKNLQKSVAAQLDLCRKYDGKIAELERVAKKIDREIG